MSSVRIDVDEGGMAEVSRTFKRVRDNFLDDCLPDARRNAPVDSGDLFLSIGVDHSAGTLFADTDYAAAVELGASPHEIPNAWGRGITVEHPGTKAQPYLRPAVYRARRLRA